LLASITAAALGPGWGCGDATQPAIGPDCTALIETAGAAAACDERLTALAAQIAANPDETRCRTVVRTMLNDPATDPPRVQTVFVAQVPVDASPLSPRELQSLRQWPHPAEIVVTPDLRREPAVAATTVIVDGLPLVEDSHGRLRGHLTPGSRTLTVRHAGKEETYCISLRACERVVLVSHGARLAKHRDASAGPCFDGSTGARRKEAVDSVKNGADRPSR
jgi:hypothetical protein